MRRSLFLLIALVAALTLRAAGSWDTFLREEPARARRDDRIFDTLDRRLNALRTADPADAPAFRLLAAETLAQALGQFDRSRSGPDVPPASGAPAQTWTARQAETCLRTLRTQIFADAPVYASLPAEPILRLTGGAPDYPGLSALALLATRVGDCGDGTVDRLRDAADRAGDTVAAGLLLLERLSALPDDSRLPACEAALDEPGLDGEIRARILLLMAQSLPDEDATAARRADLLREGLRTASVHTTCAALQHAYNALRRAELRIEALPDIVAPGPLTIPVAYRNAGRLTVECAGVLTWRRTLRLPETAHLHGWGKTDLSLPALPPGELRLTLTPDTVLGEPVAPLTHTLRVCSFTAARVCGDPLTVAVADIATDRPLEGARVTWLGHTAVTDADGLARFPRLSGGGRDGEQPLRIEARGETLTLREAPVSPYASRAGRRVLCVTDRTLYRPGDTVRWEAVACDIADDGSPRPVAGESLTVTWTGRTPAGTVFRAESQHRTASAGSVSGEFTLPGDFTGSVSLLVDGRWAGTSVTVAAFRAPELGFEPEVSLRGVAFGDPVQVSGTVRDLSGLPVADARVVWTLDADVPLDGGCRTASDGTFRFDFVPVPAGSGSDMLWARLTVTVTAPNGDGLARSVPVVISRYGIRLEAEAPEWIVSGTSFDVTLSAQRPVSGTLKAFRDGGQEACAEVPFDLKDPARPLAVTLSLPAGLYNLQAESSDGRVSAYTVAEILPADGSMDAFGGGARLRVREPHGHAYAVGEAVTGFAAVSGQAPARLAVFGRGGLLAVLPLKDPFFSLPVTGDLAGGFTLAVYGFDRGRFFSARTDLEVCRAASLKLEMVRFPARTAPGTPQVWELAVDDPEAEVVLTCYDAALDALSPYDWSGLALPFSVYSAPWRTLTGYFGDRRVGWGETLPRDFVLGAGYGIRPRMMMKSNAQAAADGGAAFDASAAESLSAQDEAASGAEAPPPRSDFARTALWAPQRRLENGRAVYTFTLPDSLTEWKVMAFAHTPDGRSGTLVRTVVAAKDLMLRPYLPRTLRTGDRLTVAVQVSNATDAPLETWVELDGGDRRTLTLPPESSRSVAWEVAAPAQPGIRTFTFTAPGDAVRIDVPVLDTLLAVEDVYPVTLLDTAPRTLRIPTPVPGTDVTWDLSADPMKAVLEAVTPLLEPACGSSDAAFARVAAMALLRHAGTAQPELPEALSGLLARRNADGLWPWFPGGRSDPLITADILVGIARLHALGAAPEALTAAALDCLGRAGGSLPFAAELYARSLLPEGGSPGGNLAGRAADFLREGRGDIQEDRMVTVAALRLGFDEAAAAGKARVLGAMNRSPAWGTWWPQERRWWGWWGTPLGSHVLGYEVLSAAGEADAARGAALWLLQHRRLNGWGAARDTLAAVYALLAEGFSPESPAPEIRVTRAQTPGETVLTFARSAPGVTFGRVTAAFRTDVSCLPPPPADPEAALTLDVKTDADPGASVGDTVPVTVTLHAAQPMQYVRVAVPRPANAEPADLLPHWERSAGAYVEPGDAADIFWIPQLRRGYTVLRYDLRVTHAGTCAVAPASATLLHAPDVAARTAGASFSVH